MNRKSRLERRLQPGMAAPLTLPRLRRRIPMQRRQFLRNTLSAPMIAAGWKLGPPAGVESELAQMIGVVRSGTPGWIRPLGMRNVEAQERVTADTVFQAASLSKQVTAYAALALRESGKLDFDRTLVSYVDDLTDERARRVTPRHVLGHSSGFPN